MKPCLAILFFAAACASPPAPVTRQNVEGVAVFERAEDESGGLVTLDGVEWRGGFAVEADCLVLSLDGAKYTPIFLNRSASRTAFADLGLASPRRGANNWSLQGSRVSEPDQAGYAKVTGTCGKPAFLVAGLSDPKAPPPAN